eukprot:142134_1
MRSTPSLSQSTASDISVEFATASINNAISSYSSNYSHLSIQSAEETQESTSFMTLLTNLSMVDEDILFLRNGYQKVNKICDTLQGELYKAIQVDTNQHVAIKRTDKRLSKNNIAVEDDITFCVSANCIQEAEILKYLTLDHTPIGNYIVQYIDWFESEDDYYLVMEYVASETNIRQFISRAKQRITNGTLSTKQYRKMVKCLLWQLFVTVQWLHLSMKCCHLNLCLENILLENANFIKTKNGVVIDPNISIKLCSFGVAQVFRTDNFVCDKQPLSLDQEAYSAPKVFNEELYDARAADNWKLGMCLFECMTMGQRMYQPLEVHVPFSGHWAVNNNGLKGYLNANNLLNHFNVDSFGMLNALLNIKEAERLKGMDILKHSWFNMYYRRYKKQIKKKFRV